MLLFMIIYFYEVCGFDFGIFGVLMSFIVIMGFVVMGFGGMFIDCFGVCCVLIVGLLLMIVGCMFLVYVMYFVVVIVVVVFIGVNFGVFWFGFNVLIVLVVDGEVC